MTTTYHRDGYGVAVPSTGETLVCQSRSDADRVRRVLRAYGALPGWRETRSLASHALRCKGMRASAIIATWTREPSYTLIKKEV